MAFPDDRSSFRTWSTLRRAWQTPAAAGAAVVLASLSGIADEAQTVLLASGAGLRMSRCHKLPPACYKCAVIKLRVGRANRLGSVRKRQTACAVRRIACSASRLSLACPFGASWQTAARREHDTNRCRLGDASSKAESLRSPSSSVPIPWDRAHACERLRSAGRSSDGVYKPRMAACGSRPGIPGIELALGAAFRVCSETAFDGAVFVW